jgi:hypothetical protein
MRFSRTVRGHQVLFQTWLSAMENYDMLELGKEISKIQMASEIQAWNDLLRIHLPKFL